MMITVMSGEIGSGVGDQSGFSRKTVFAQEVTVGMSGVREEEQRTEEQNRRNGLLFQLTRYFYGDIEEAGKLFELVKPLSPEESGYIKSEAISSLSDLYFNYGAFDRVQKLLDFRVDDQLLLQEGEVGEFKRAVLEDALKEMEEGKGFFLVQRLLDFKFGDKSFLRENEFDEVKRAVLAYLEEREEDWSRLKSIREGLGLKFNEVFFLEKDIKNLVSTWLKDWLGRGWSEGAAQEYFDLKISEGLLFRKDDAQQFENDILNGLGKRLKDGHLLAVAGIQPMLNLRIEGEFILKDKVETIRKGLLSRLKVYLKEGNFQGVQILFGLKMGEEFLMGEEEVKNAALEVLLQLGTASDWGGMRQILDLKFEGGELTMAEALGLDFWGKIKRIVESVGAHGIKIETQCLRYLYPLWRSGELREEQVEACLEIVQEILNSPSVELNNFAGEIVEEVLKGEDMKESFSQIKNVFARNNLAIPEKIFKVMQILHSGTRLDDKIDGGMYMSPNLREANSLRRREIILSDLQKISLDSNNRSLRQGLEILAQGKEILNSITDEMGEIGGENDIAVLKENEGEKYSQLVSFLNRLTTFYTNGFFGGLETNKDDLTATVLSLESSPADCFSRYQFLRERLGADGMGLDNSEMMKYLFRFGRFGSAEAVLAYMDNQTLVTDKRHRDLLVGEGGKQLKELKLQNGDLLKGVISSGDINLLGGILQNGSVAKEYLGTSETPPKDVSVGDATPLDTDLVRFPSKVAEDYGSLRFVLRDFPGRFNLTREGEDEGLETKYDPLRPELFQTGVLLLFRGDKRYGIRTGFASSEIDWIVLGSDWEEENRERVFFEIARNGFYIPVTDEEGKVIFTPQMYDSYRRGFDGLSRFGEKEFHFADDLGQENGEIQKLVKGNDGKPSLSEGREITLERRGALVAKINEALAKLCQEENEEIVRVCMGNEAPLRMKEAMDWDLSAGLELVDTGSTSRFTNAPGEGDFDLILRVDPVVFNDERLLGSLSGAIKQSLVADGFEDDRSKGARSLRLKKAKIHGEEVDIDLTIVKKSGATDYATNQSLEEKLQLIKQQDSEKYELVVANIVLAKQKLKERGVYKKAIRDSDQGGLGGVGVENWILQNGGSMKRAAETFLESAIDEGGKVRPFDDFVKDYPIFDAGKNFYAADEGSSQKKFGNYPHDNFTRNNLNQGGYEGMVEFCKEVVGGG
jgi:hypothetical protein